MFLIHEPFFEELFLIGLIWAFDEKESCTHSFFLRKIKDMMLLFTKICYKLIFQRSREKFSSSFLSSLAFSPGSKVSYLLFYSAWNFLNWCFFLTRIPINHLFFFLTGLLFFSCSTLSVSMGEFISYNIL